MPLRAAKFRRQLLTMNLSKRKLLVFFTISSYHKIIDEILRWSKEIPEFDRPSIGHFGCFLKQCCTVPLFLEHLSGFVLVFCQEPIMTTAVNYGFLNFLLNEQKGAKHHEHGIPTFLNIYLEIEALRMSFDAIFLQFFVGLHHFLLDCVEFLRSFHLRNSYFFSIYLLVNMLIADY